jgi:hypothetical protein
LQKPSRRHIASSTSSGNEKAKSLAQVALRAKDSGYRIIW